MTVQFAADLRPGRFCPTDYHLTDADFDQKQAYSADCFYIAGGLYGNPFALRKLCAMAAEENAFLVFNGDMHWFDLDPAIFAEIEEETAKAGRLALLGNVEQELLRSEENGAGCGCAYPSCVSDEAVARSNAMHALLKEMLRKNPELSVQMQSRKRTAVLELPFEGNCRYIAVTHGDEKSLGGWDCGYDALSSPARQAELDKWLFAHGFCALSCSHTCCAAALRLPHGAVINNGAAGLSNFNGKEGCFGVVTRIAKAPHTAALYRTELSGLFIEALPIRYNNEAFLQWFDEIWTADSPAALSYRERITEGLSGMRIADADLGGFSVCTV